jgi:hypothetical protein
MVLLIIERTLSSVQSNCRTSSANRLFLIGFAILHGA